jgi:hypothetical protein
VNPGNGGDHGILHIRICALWQYARPVPSGFDIKWKPIVRRNKGIDPGLQPMGFGGVSDPGSLSAPLQFGNGDSGEKDSGRRNFGQPTHYPAVRTRFGRL